MSNQPASLQRISLYRHLVDGSDFPQRICRLCSKADTNKTGLYSLLSKIDIWGFIGTPSHQQIAVYFRLEAKILQKLFLRL